MCRLLLVCVTLLLLVPSVGAQEADRNTPAASSSDWSTFDPAAALAAASEPPQEMPFKRRWTTKERVRLLHGLAISANGKRVLAIASDGRPQVYDGDSGKPLVKVSGDLGLIKHAALSPDGSRGAIALVSTEVVTFDAASGKILHRHPPGDAKDGSQFTPRISVLQFTADGRHVAWVANNGRFQRADVASGERINHLFHGPISDTRTTGLSPDGLVACQVNTRQLLLTYLVLPEPGSDKEPEVLERKYGEEAPVTIAMSPNLLAFHTLLGRVVVQHSLHRRLPPGTRQKSSSTNHLTASRTGDMQLQFSSDEKWLLALGRGQAELRRLDDSSLPSLHNLEVSNVAQAALAADVRRIAVVDEDGRLSMLALEEEPKLPIWELSQTLDKLVREKQFELLDKLSDAVQDDPEPFWFNPGEPKHHTLIEKLLPYDAKLIEQWLEQRPDSKLARLLHIRQLMYAGWKARGTGFANTVSPEGWNVFHQKVTEAHAEMKKLLAQDRPPPEAWMWLFDIAKGESWSEEQCLDEAERAMERSPQYLTPHLCLAEKLLMRWGGEQHSAALYASWASDKIGGPAGDALYAQLAARVAAYEDKDLLREQLGFDWDRAYKGCQALQDMPQRRALGVLIELELAHAVGDTDRLPRVAQIIESERTPYYFRPGLPRHGFERLYRENVDRVVTDGKVKL